MLHLGGYGELEDTNRAVLAEYSRAFSAWTFAVGQLNGQDDGMQRKGTKKPSHS